MCVFLQRQNENQARGGEEEFDRKKGGLCRKTLRAIVRFFSHTQFCQVTRRNPESTLRYCSFNEVINTQAAVVGLVASLSFPDCQKTLLKEHLKTRLPSIKTLHYTQVSTTFLRFTRLGLKVHFHALKPEPLKRFSH